MKSFYRIQGWAGRDAQQPPTRKRSRTSGHFGLVAGMGLCSGKCECPPTAEEGKPQLYDDTLTMPQPAAPPPTNLDDGMLGDLLFGELCVDVENKNATARSSNNLTPGRPCSRGRTNSEGERPAGHAIGGQRPEKRGATFAALYYPPGSASPSGSSMAMTPTRMGATPAATDESARIAERQKKKIAELTVCLVNIKI